MSSSSVPLSLPTGDLHGLSIPLLDTRLGNFEASVNSTQPCKGGVLEIGPVVIFCHLKHSASLGKGNQLKVINFGYNGVTASQFLEATIPNK